MDHFPYPYPLPLDAIHGGFVRFVHLGHLGGGADKIGTVHNGDEFDASPLLPSHKPQDLLVLLIREFLSPEGKEK